MEADEELRSREDKLKAMLGQSWMAPEGDQATEETDVVEDSSPPEEEPKPEPVTAEPSPRGEVQPQGDEEGEKRVPYNRFAKVNEEKNSYKTAAEAEKARNAELEKELAELRKKDRDRSLEEMYSEENLPQGFADWSYARQQAHLQEMAMSAYRSETDARMAAMEERIAAPSDVADRLQISEDVGQSLTAHQFAEIKAIKAESPGLSSRQLLLLAKDKAPDLFQSAGAGRPPASTQVTPPRPSGVGAGGNRKESEKPDVSELLANAKTPEEREAAGIALFQQILS